ncbi:MAG: PIN domain-containing protein [Chloroflexota bacterium]
METIFLDTSVLIRYFATDDPTRALAAARLIDSEAAVVVSTGSVIETIHVMRTQYGARNPDLGLALIEFLSKHNVALADADAGAVVAGIGRTLGSSERRIPDAILAAAAEQAGCDWIATFDESFVSPTVPSRLI